MSVRIEYVLLEADTAEGLTKLVNEYSFDDWKLRGDPKVSIAISKGEYSTERVASYIQAMERCVC